MLKQTCEKFIWRFDSPEHSSARAAECVASSTENPAPIIKIAIINESILLSEAVP